MNVHMLARRLLVFALVLLVVTTLSTALAPPRRIAAPSSSGERSPVSAEGAVIERTLDAGKTDPPTISLSEGDRLKLTVTSEESGAVELDGLGQVRAIAPGTDAVFDVLPSRPGTFGVLFVGEERTIGTLRVVAAD